MFGRSCILLLILLYGIHSRLTSGKSRKRILPDFPPDVTEPDSGLQLEVQGRIEHLPLRRHNRAKRALQLHRGGGGYRGGGYRGGYPAHGHPHGGHIHVRPVVPVVYPHHHHVPIVPVVYPHHHHYLPAPHVHIRREPEYLDPCGYQCVNWDQSTYCCPHYVNKPVLTAILGGILGIIFLACCIFFCLRCTAVREQPPPPPPPLQAVCNGPCLEAGDPSAVPVYPTAPVNAPPMYVDQYGNPVQNVPALVPSAPPLQQEVSPAPIGPPPPYPGIPAATGAPIPPVVPVAPEVKEPPVMSMKENSTQETASKKGKSASKSSKSSKAKTEVKSSPGGTPTSPAK